MPNNNNYNREDNKGCLEGLLESLFVGIIELFVVIVKEIFEIIFISIIEAFVEIGRKILEYIFAIIAIIFVIYLLVTFLINHA